MMRRRPLSVSALGLLGALAVCSHVRADGQVLLTAARPAEAAHEPPALPGTVARLLAVLSDGARLARLTPARVRTELPIGSVREPATSPERDARVLVAAGDGRSIDRALVRLDAAEPGALRELDVVLSAERPHALFESMVARVRRDLGAPRWTSSDAALFCLPAAAGQASWALYVAGDEQRASVRAIRDGLDCSAP